MWVKYLSPLWGPASPFLIIPAALEFPSGAKATSTPDKEEAEIPSLQVSPKTPQTVA